MRKIGWILVCCSLICLSAYRWGDMRWENAKIAAMEHLYSEVSKLMMPYLHTYGVKMNALVYADVEHFFMPMMTDAIMAKQEEIGQDDINSEAGEAETEMNVGGNPEIEKTPEIEEVSKIEEVVETESQKEESSETASTNVIALEKKVTINRLKLQEFDYLRQNFFQVDNTTTVGSDLLDVNKLLDKSMKIKDNIEGPQILIYHTHSQEAYKDSIPGDPATTIVGVGDYLEMLLEQKYGIQVLHHKGVYDMPRDSAYSAALPNIEKVLQENPTIEVVIDLHRDGVAENRHLVTEVNGKQTAKLMFFNGLCKTTAQGDLAYLPNPYILDNLALSFQMQLAAEEYYPGLMRKIYLKGYRYNLHLRPKSMLVEVGAQTNTLEEAKNAMEPLANILAMVLTEKLSTNESK